MSNDNVTPLKWTSTRKCKLGLATVTIKQVQDLFEASVLIQEGDSEFYAEGIFSSAREAEIWTYGCKQEQNDYFSGYQRQGDNLVETKPAKGKPADVISVVSALAEVQHNYDHFELGRSSAPKGNTVSVKELTTSSLISDEEKAFMAGILAKLGKVTNA